VVSPQTGCGGLKRRDFWPEKRYKLPIAVTDKLMVIDCKRLIACSFYLSGGSKMDLRRGEGVGSGAQTRHNSVRLNREHVRRLERTHGSG